MSTSNMSDSDIIKCSSMVKRAQGKSTFGLINLRKRVFVLTRLKLCYYDGTLDVSTTAAHTHTRTCHMYTHVYSACKHMHTPHAAIVYRLARLWRTFQFLSFSRNMETSREKLLCRQYEQWSQQPTVLLTIQPFR